MSIYTFPAKKKSEAETEAFLNKIKIDNITNIQFYRIKVDEDYESAISVATDEYDLFIGLIDLQSNLKKHINKTRGFNKYMASLLYSPIIDRANEKIKELYEKLDFEIDTFYEALKNAFDLHNEKQKIIDGYTEYCTNPEPNIDYILKCVRYCRIIIKCIRRVQHYTKVFANRKMLKNNNVLFESLFKMIRKLRCICENCDYGSEIEILIKNRYKAAPLYDLMGQIEEEAMYARYVSYPDEYLYEYVPSINKDFPDNYVKLITENQDTSDSENEIETAKVAVQKVNDISCLDKRMLAQRASYLNKLNKKIIKKPNQSTLDKHFIKYDSESEKYY